MSDTIELLEAIGKDASLRHASADDLAGTLAQADASTALRSAVAAGDSSLLSTELGFRLNQAPQVFNAPGHEEDEPGEQEEKPNGEPDPNKNMPQPQ